MKYAQHHTGKLHGFEINGTQDLSKRREGCGQHQNHITAGHTRRSTTAPARTSLPLATWRSEEVPRHRGGAPSWSSIPGSNETWTRLMGWYQLGAGSPSSSQHKGLNTSHRWSERMDSLILTVAFIDRCFTRRSDTGPNIQRMMLI